MSTYNVNCEKSLGELNNHLSKNMFIGGNHPNAQDALTFEAFNEVAPDVAKYPSVAAWFYLVHYFRHVMESWKVDPKKEEKGAKGGNKKETKKTVDDDLDDMFGDAEEKKPQAKKDDVDDMFENDEDEDPAAAKARQERMKRALEAKKKKDAAKGKKAEVIAKSLILLDVKVWEQETSLDDLAKKILEIKKDGLEWKTEYKTPEVAFGMKKLVVGCVVEDEKVSVDDIIEIITGWEDTVQSVDIACFNKI